MKLSDLIRMLEELKEKEGDLPVRWQSLSHLFEPEPTVRPSPPASSKYVLLNP